MHCVDTCVRGVCELVQYIVRFHIHELVNSVCAPEILVFWHK